MEWIKCVTGPCLFLVSGTTDKGVVEVTNCFCVPHKEHDDQVEAELGYAHEVFELNRRVNPNENIVGRCFVSRETVHVFIWENSPNATSAFRMVGHG